MGSPDATQSDASNIGEWSHKHVSILVAVLVLAGGCVFYLLERPTLLAFHGFDVLPYRSLDTQDVGFPVGALPSFLHTFAFILLFASLFPYSQLTFITITVFWILVEVLFEFLQKETSFVRSLSEFASAVFPDGFQVLFAGTFDLLDVAAIFLGGAAAYAFLQIRRKEGIPK